MCMYDLVWPSHCDCEPFHWLSQPSDYQSRKNPIPIVTPAGHHYDNHQATDCTANQRQSEPLIHHESSHFQCSNLYSWPWMLFLQWLAYYIERWYYAVYFQCLCDNIKNMIKLSKYDLACKNLIEFIFIFITPIQLLLFKHSILGYW